MGAGFKILSAQALFHGFLTPIKGLVLAMAKSVGSWRFSGKLLKAENLKTKNYNQTSNSKLQAPNSSCRCCFSKAIKTVISVRLWTRQI